MTNVLVTGGAGFIGSHLVDRLLREGDARVTVVDNFNDFDDPVANPIPPYAAPKLAGEAACHVYSHVFGLRVVCLRLFTVYGARQRPDLVIHKFAKLITEGKPLPIFGNGTTRRDYTYIDDIIDGIVTSMKYESSSFEVINLGGAHTVDLRRIVDLLEQALGKRAVIEDGPPQ